VPEKIANRPDLYVWLIPVYLAFYALVTCRNSEGGIPWTAVRQYAEVNGFADNLTEYNRFWTLINSVDLALRANDQQKQKTLADKRGKESAKPKKNDKTIGTKRR
jgi:hypothetical protein